MLISMTPNDDVKTIHCSQNDTTLRKWMFNLYNDDELYTPTGTVSLICSNGTEIPMTNESTGLYCDCTSDLSRVSGTFDCKIKIVNGDEVLHSSLFKLVVEVKP